MVHEDNEEYAKAEALFIEAGCASEAIKMYLHTHDWLAAQRVADEHHPASSKDVLVAQVSSSNSTSLCVPQPKLIILITFHRSFT